MEPARRIARLLAQKKQSSLETGIGEVVALDGKHVIIKPTGSSAHIRTSRECNPKIGDRVRYLVKGTKWYAISVIGGEESSSSLILNGEENDAPDFYAPNDSGTLDQILSSGGLGAPPVWVDKNIYDMSVNKVPNLGWVWVKYTDGRSEAWIRFSATVSPNLSWNYGYYSNPIALAAYPVGVFITNPIYNLSIDDSSGGVWETHTVPQAANPGQVYTMSFAPYTSRGISGSIHSIGNWK